MITSKNIMDYRNKEVFVVVEDPNNPMERIYASGTLTIKPVSNIMSSIIIDNVTTSDGTHLNNIEGALCNNNDKTSIVLPCSIFETQDRATRSIIAYHTTDKYQKYLIEETAKKCHELFMNNEMIYFIYNIGIYHMHLPILFKGTIKEFKVYPNSKIDVELSCTFKTLEVVSKLDEMCFNNVLNNTFKNNANTFWLSHKNVFITKEDAMQAFQNQSSQIINTIKKVIDENNGQIRFYENRNDILNNYMTYYSKLS